MAAKTPTSLEDIMADPRFERLSDEGKLEIRMRYFQKHVEPSKQYQEALSPKRREMQMAIVGGDFAPLTPDEQAAVPAPSPTPGAMPVPGAPAPQEAQEGEGILRGLMKPGGMLSPMSQGIMGGGMTGAGYGGLATGGNPLGVLGGGIIGAGLGAMGGRGYEMAIEPGEAPESLSAGVADLGMASQEGMKAEALGMIGGAATGKVIDKMARPLGQMTSAMGERLGRAQSLGIPMRAGQIRDNAGMTRLEELSAMLGSKRAISRLRAEHQAQQKAALELVEQISPGVSEDLSVVGNAMVKGIKGREREAMDAASELYEHAKRAVGPGDFGATNLEKAASLVVGAEQPMASLANPALRTARPFSVSQEVLESVGYTPGRSYTFPELLEINKRLGSAMRRTKDRTAKRELMSLWEATGADMEDAAKAAGAEDVAMPLLSQGKAFYRDYIVPVFRDRKMLREMAKDPSLAARTMLSPEVPVEHLSRVRRGLGDTSKEWQQVQRKWFDNLAEQAVDEVGEFNSRNFLKALDGYDKYGPEKLKVIAGKNYDRLRDLQKVLQDQERNASQGLMKHSLTMGRIIGVIRGMQGAGVLGGGAINPGVGMAAAGIFSMPSALGKILHSDRGIRWLTVGLNAKNPKQAARALSELAAISAVKDDTDDEGFSLGRAAGF